MKKHGAYVDPGNSNLDSVVFYWMGEPVQLDDFNQRLAGMTESAGKDINWFLQGFNAKKVLNEGQKTVAQLDELEKVAKLPLCPACRKLIGDPL